MMSPEDFSTQVENVVYDSDGDLDYVDGVLHVAEGLGLDYEASAELLTPPILALVKIDFERRRLVPKTEHLSEDW